VARTTMFVEEFARISRFVHSSPKIQHRFESKTIATQIDILRSYDNETLDPLLPDFKKIEVFIADLLIDIMFLAEENKYHIAEAVEARLSYHERQKQKWI
jgi:hypothetical protein